MIAAEGKVTVDLFRSVRDQVLSRDPTPPDSCRSVLGLLASRGVGWPHIPERYPEQFFFFLLQRYYTQDEVSYRGEVRLKRLKGYVLCVTKI